MQRPPLPFPATFTTWNRNWASVLDDSKFDCWRLLTGTRHEKWHLFSPIGSLEPTKTKLHMSPTNHAEAL